MWCCRCVYAGDTSLPAAWKGVRRTTKLCCDEQASAFFVEERLQSVATELIQAAWRRRKASKLAAVGASVGRHWNLSEGMQSVHGPDAEELPLTLKTLFVSLGTAAKIIIRWWRRRRRTLWSKAANVIRNAWKWNRHRYHQVGLSLKLGMLKLLVFLADNSMREKDWRCRTRGAKAT